MTIMVSAFRWVPPFAQGYVKDLRVRWALEEAGLPYEAALIGPDDQGSGPYRQWQPFGQVPAFRDGAVDLFESGAIVLHLAAQSEALAPRDAAGRARVTAWVIAALNSVEPFAQNLLQFENAPKDEAWAAKQRQQVKALLDSRLKGLAAWLGDRDYLEGRFTAGDLMMTMVLRELVECGALAAFPTIDRYRERCEGRPAFARALEAQLSAFREHEPA